MPSPANIQTEIDIVRSRVSQLSNSLELRAEMPNDELIENVITIFRELRNGKTLDNTQKLKTTTGVLSTAEAISLLANSMALAASFGNGKIVDYDIAAALQGAIVKDEEKDKIAWKEYLENVMKKRGERYRTLYKECKELNR